MEMHVLVERTAENGYRAVTGPPFQIAVEGGTREEALTKVRTAVAEKIRGGAEFLRLEVPGGPSELILCNQQTDNPWLRIAGIFENDPFFEEWQQAIAEYR